MLAHTNEYLLTRTMSHDMSCYESNLKIKRYPKIFRLLPSYDKYTTKSLNSLLSRTSYFKTLDSRRKRLLKFQSV